ncbi:MAG: phospholipase D-like domain-containing protein [Anaerolineae bacterium]|jgi:phosphatidylserine/phosphatidylglycerophosphate/cardiolipin synthase-like enzyme|nr:phospholipase D-like domain-containing protein [Anaerolineae bacterium]
MSQKQRKQPSKRNPIVSLLITIGTGIVIVIAVLLTNLTGIDFVGLLTGTSASTPNAPTAVVNATSAPSGNVTPIQIGQGFGARKGFWEVYFTAPTGSTDTSTYRNGVDAPLATAIGAVRQTLDIAAFEWNNPAINQAVVAAKQRGVRVRVVADNEHTIEDDGVIQALIDVGIPVVYDERSAFMHNKFMIMDSTTVWTGSTNFTINDVYRNNNNLLMLRSRQAVQVYQTEFNEMFEQRQFGPRSPNSNSANFTQDGVGIQIFFAPEGEVMPAIIREIGQARRSIRFMAFSFTYDDLLDAMLARAEQNVTIEGIFETRGSETEFSELRPLFCDGFDVRQDGNSFTMHHKVIIIDDATVIVGSFNFSQNAVQSNDENLLIIKDRDLVAQYLAEYERLKRQSRRPGITCS